MQTAPLNPGTLSALIAQRPWPRSAQPAPARRWRPALRPGAVGVLASLLSGLCFTGGAATRYVDVNNDAPAPPHATWATAATTIPSAVEAAATGDEVLGPNGVYQAGARQVYGMGDRPGSTAWSRCRQPNPQP